MEVDTNNVTYHESANGSKRNKRKLTDSIGYTYTVKASRKKLPRY